MQANRLEALRTALQKELAPVSLEIMDDSAKHAGHAGAREGGHFRVVVVANAFNGLSQLQRHRLVYAAVEPLMGHAPPELKIHALNIVARTPEESV
jgi:BolA family transcriptional regulator, general stress-responsive regulator